MTKVCASCGHPLPDDEVLLDLTRSQQRLFLALRQAGRAGLDYAALIERLYNGPDGGPERAKNYMRVQILRMNDALKPHGLRVASKRSSVRRLEKIG